MHKLPLKKRVQIISCLVEGMSIRAVTRVVGCSKNTVVKLLAEVGEACHAYQDEHLRNLTCKRIQMDEIWSFVGKKQRNVSEDDDPAEVGDVWTWTAICADTKLAPSWLVGQRDAEYASAFVGDLASRLSIVELGRSEPKLRAVFCTTQLTATSYAELLRAKDHTMPVRSSMKISN